jgi:hypothetical protein
MGILHFPKKSRYHALFGVATPSKLTRRANPREPHPDRLARRIGLPATCQLQSIAKPLSVDANAVP